MTVDLEKKNVERVFDVDVDKLFSDLDTAIEYLSSVRAAHPGKRLMLDEHWTGYEENEFRFLCDDMETDEEHQKRVTIELAREDYEERQKSEKRDREIAVMRKQRDELERKLSELAGKWS